MMRKMVVVGDPPAPGGAVLPYSSRSYTLHGHQVALIGGRAYCQGCNSVGIIAKAGGPRRMNFISDVALEGDVVICHCPVPPPLMATLVHTSWYDDMAGGSGELQPHMLAAGWLSADRSTVAASKKLVDSEVTHPPEAEQTENICPNMTNREFAALVIKLRDEALVLTAQRLQELERWDDVARARIKEWFGDVGPWSDKAHLDTMRDYLKEGLIACDRVLRGLEPKNFVRWSQSALKHVGCVSGSQYGIGVSAEVCKPDTKTHTISIAMGFCELPRDMRLFGIETIRDGDSKLLTLVHEVTHFDDVFSSFDDWYGTKNAREKILNTKDFAKARTNADSIASYILGVSAKASI